MSHYCQIKGCRKKARYGFEKPTNCSNHYKNDMKLLVKRCTYGSCGPCYIIPRYAYPGKEAERCGKHKKRGMRKIKLEF
jgi:hypothetical protein